jgi:hypothetical protein
MKKLGGFPNGPTQGDSRVHRPEQRVSLVRATRRRDQRLRLALYHPTSFLRNDLPAEIRSRLSGQDPRRFTQEGREKILISMMKVNFLKRLESSVDSFR